MPPRRAWGGAPRGVGALADLAESVLGDCLSVASVLGLPVAEVCGTCCYSVVLCSLGQLVFYTLVILSYIYHTHFTPFKLGAYVGVQLCV